MDNIKRALYTVEIFDRNDFCTDFYYVKQAQIFEIPGILNDIMIFWALQII